MSRLTLVETTGPFLLVDPNTGYVIQSHRPSVVLWSNFVESKIGAKALRLICDHLKEEATDEEFESFLESSEGDLPMAVDSFLSLYAEEGAEIGDKSGAPDTPIVDNQTPPVPLKESKKA